jgi:hypothetical protein
MSVYTPHFAPIAVLAFLGTGALLALCVAVALIGALRGSRPAVMGALAAGVTILAGYAAVLFGLSLFSRDVEISEGAWKYFCEIDCHIAYTVGGMKTAEYARPELQAAAANSSFAIVQLKTWFDPTTISPRRGNGPLTPNRRTLTLLDDRGRRFAPSVKTEAVLAAAGLHSTSLREALRPGESYVSYIVFEIPRDAKGLKLLVTSSDEEGFLIWDDENSPWHRKAYFRLART